MSFLIVVFILRFITKLRFPESRSLNNFIRSFLEKKGFSPKVYEIFTDRAIHSSLGFDKLEPLGFKQCPLSIKLTLGHLN